MYLKPPWLKSFWEFNSMCAEKNENKFDDYGGDGEYDDDAAADDNKDYSYRQ